MIDLVEFRYLNDPLIQQFLEQLLDGSIDVTTRQETSGRTGKAGVTARLGGVGGEAGRSKVEETRVTHSLKPTPTSRAKQLVALLGEELHPLSAMDDDAWASVRPGAFVSVTGDLEIPSTAKSLLVGLALEKSLGAFEGVMPKEEFLNARSQLDQIKSVGRALEADGFPVLLKGANGGPDIVFVARPEHTRGPAIELDRASCTLVGRIIRTVGRGEIIRQSELLPSLSEHLGTSGNRAQRRANQTSEIELRGPAAVVRPLCVFE